MADSPIGITFMPSAAAAADAPRQAAVDGPGGSDLAQAFKILSLHLPNILGAGAIAPKKLLNSPGAAGVAGGSGFNPYAAVFQSLLQSSGLGNTSPGGVGSLSSLFGDAPTPVVPDGLDTPGGVPPPRVTPGKDFVPIPGFGGGPSDPGQSYTDTNVANDTRYI